MAEAHEVLMDDGVFCEFAVVEPLELERIPFALARRIARWHPDLVPLQARLTRGHRSNPSSARSPLDGLQIRHAVPAQRAAHTRWLCATGAVGRLRPVSPACVPSRQFTFTIAGGLQLPLPAGRIDGASDFGQYSRITV
jgi:hypothetical protein